MAKTPFVLARRTETKTLMCAAELITNARAAAEAEAATAAATAAAAAEMAAAAAVAATAAAAAGAGGNTNEQQQAADAIAAASSSTVEDKNLDPGNKSEAPGSMGGIRLQEALEAVCTVVTNGLEVRLPNAGAGPQQTCAQVVWDSGMPDLSTPFQS